MISQDTYLKGPQCPHCGNENFELNEKEASVNDLTVFIPCFCKNCTAKWDEVYHFSHFLPFEEN